MGSGTCWALLNYELVVYVGSENTQCLQLFRSYSNLTYLLKDLSKMVAWTLLRLLRIAGSHLSVTDLWRSVSCSLPSSTTLCSVATSGLDLGEG